MLHLLRINKRLGDFVAWAFFVVQCRRKERVMGEQEKKQAVEINRIRSILIKRGLRRLGAVDPIDLSLAYLTLVVEVHRSASSMDTEDMRTAIKNMVDYILDHTSLIPKKDLN